MSNLDKLEKELQDLANSKQAQNLQKFFKTGRGEYGEGDKFLGIKVPEQRKVVKRYYQDLDFKDLQKLLNSKIHECRLVALLILVAQFQKGDKLLKEKIYNFYLKNTKAINNWDLVDLSAPNIVGSYLLDKKSKRKVLYKLAKSKNLWERRISALSTFSFIREKDFADALNLAKIHLNDQHDLIHKAVGWMLREIGKKDKKVLAKFLDANSFKLPRTMLRYAIEKLPKNKKIHYLLKK